MDEGCFLFKENKYEPERIDIFHRVLAKQDPE
jgi:hypothetical protein